MTISYPLNLPTVKVARHVNFRKQSTVAISASSFTHEQQVYVHQGEWWEADVQLPPMQRANAETWIGFLLALNGREGTFLMGDPVGETPRGIATGVPVVDGGSQTGKTLRTRGWTQNTAGILLSGDWLQFGSGSSAHLHKMVQDADVDLGSPVLDVASLEIWPRLRSSPANGDAIIVSAAKGLWRLSSNVSQWSIDEAVIFGIEFSCEEAL